ncbi:hypothetical protein [Reyranella sp.]|uniref:hypothetical protein n=1 Tax=Reyranella sp. TaxID=1929291 RepID=UPI003C7E4ED5
MAAAGWSADSFTARIHFRAGSSFWNNRIGRLAAARKHGRRAQLGRYLCWPHERDWSHHLACVRSEGARVVRHAHFDLQKDRSAAILFARAGALSGCGAVAYALDDTADAID